jgi:uncharacterized iron-regulated membrane protein
MIGAGLFLMLKKEISWIQPETQRGTEATVPSLPIEQLFQAAKSVQKAEFTTWGALERADFKPGKGVIKFVSQNGWEVQVDTHTGQILQAAIRRSDLIEALHDGSFFSDGIKLFVFFPAGIVLFVLWLTGLYLFFLPHVKKRNRKQSKKLHKTQAELKGKYR